MFGSFVKVQSARIEVYLNSKSEATPLDIVLLELNRLLMIPKKSTHLTLKTQHNGSLKIKADLTLVTSVFCSFRFAHSLYLLMDCEDINKGSTLGALRIFVLLPPTHCLHI